MSGTKFQLSDLVTKYPFFLHYKGNYKENLTLKIVDIVDANLSLYFKKFVVKRLSYLVIEAVQNIERYSAGGGTSEDFCYIFSDHDYLYVITQNQIENKNIESLKSRLDHVNSKNSEELKAIYMEVLTAGDYTSKGAGLGLIDIARKSKNSLEYQFNPISEEFSVYRLNVKIPILDDESVAVPKDNSIEIIDHLSGLFNENKNTLFYSGDFSNSFLQSLLAMLNNLKKTDNLQTTSVFKYALFELNQNMKRHASKINGKIPGFITLEWQSDKAFISTFNYIPNEFVEELEKKLIRLNSSSLEKLKEECNDSVNDIGLEIGLGLTELARINWPNKIHYHFEKNDVYGQSIFLRTQLNY